MKKNIAIILIFLSNILIMNAQDKSIKLSDKLTIYQEYKEKENNITHWRLFLKKEGEKVEKLLDEAKQNNNFAFPFDDEATKKMLNSEIIMLIPNLIDAYKEKQRIYVFLYKNRSAMLQIYDFKDGIDFKKSEYSLIPVKGGGVMNYGPYIMTVYKKIIENVCFADVILSRSVGGGKGMLLRVQEDQVFELEFKDNEKTKKVISQITSFEDKKYLSEEVRKQLIANNFLKEKNQFIYLGHFDDAYTIGFRRMSGNTYFFYKDDLNPFIIKVIKYDNGEKEWTINGYTEKRLFSTQEAERWGIEK